MLEHRTAKVLLNTCRQEFLLFQQDFSFDF